MEEELLGGLPLKEVFDAFDEEPLGSASIAQVHRATLRTGREVAVKVQRPNVEQRLMSDIGVIKTFSLLTRVGPFRLGFNGFLSSFSIIFIHFLTVFYGFSRRLELGRFVCNRRSSRWTTTWCAAS